MTYRCARCGVLLVFEGMPKGSKSQGMYFHEGTMNFWCKGDVPWPNHASIDLDAPDGQLQMISANGKEY